MVVCNRRGWRCFPTICFTERSLTTHSCLVSDIGKSHRLSRIAVSRPAVTPVRAAQSILVAAPSIRSASVMFQWNQSSCLTNKSLFFWYLRKIRSRRRNGASSISFSIVRSSDRQSNLDNIRPERKFAVFATTVSFACNRFSHYPQP